jgi:bifunctional diaminopimelate decarboxylase / aspartate kinase
MIETLVQIFPSQAKDAGLELCARQVKHLLQLPASRERLERGTGYVVSFPTTLEPDFNLVIQACQAGQSDKALVQLKLMQQRFNQSSQDIEIQLASRSLVQGMALTREVSLKLEQRLRDCLTQELAFGLSQLLEIPFLQRSKLRLGLPPGHTHWMVAESVEDQPSTLALLAQSWSPQHCEFWGEDCALFTADPSQVPGARVIRTIDFQSAMELARLKNLQPSAPTLEALRAKNRQGEGVGVALRCFALDPQNEDSPAGALPLVESFTTQVVGEEQSTGLAQTLVCQSGVTLLSIESPSMWREVGFLQKLFTALAKQELSVDLMATSQTHVSITLDPTTDDLSLLQKQALETDLNAQIQILSNCAAVTLVGRRLRSLWNQLGQGLEVFDEQSIHLINHASSDVALTFVVDDGQSERLLRSLHKTLFSEETIQAHLGPTWQQLHAVSDTGSDKSSANLSLLHRWESQEWWIRKRERLLALGASDHLPLYVYDSETLLERAEQLKQLTGVSRLFYAMKANSNLEILRKLWDCGFGLECVSPGELERVHQVAQNEMVRERVMYTPNFAPKSDYEFGLKQPCWTTLDSLAPLIQWPEVFSGQEVFLRLDPGKGAGHHRHVNTGGKMSKFGISLDQLDQLLPLISKHGVRVKGLHCHAGSGILDASNWFKNGCTLAEMAETHFPHVEVLDLGGGLGVSDRPGKPPLDLSELNRYLEGLHKLYPRYEFWMEPGRFLVAESGVLLAHVTQIKQKGDRYYIGIDAGMHSLIRPSLYGAYHHIVNLTRWQQQPKWKADIVGPICESGDVLGRDRWLPECHPGDLMLISTAGAYGRVMSSEYNLRGFPGEVVL